jgi:NAD(P)-dependent dehydrogenase (short-subunit alcohol dehydrogenase family)
MAKTVLITGSSSGIGLATAQYFARQGWNVSATARNPLTEGIWSQAGSTIYPKLDVTDESTIASAVAATIERFGSLDVLVNNAGFGLFGPLEGATAQQFESIFRTNVFGTAAVIRHVLPHMRQARQGTIVNVSSVAGRIASPFLAPYNSTKYAIEGLSESLRFELEPHRIRVKIVEPGHFKSNFLTRSLRWSEHPAYEPHWSNMKAWISQSTEKAKDASIVAEAIFDAATDESDRLRFAVGGNAILSLRAILPDSLWRKMLAGGMKRKPKVRAMSKASGTLA